MALRKKQAPKKSQVRRKAQKKSMILSKEGREMEKRLVELVDSDIEEHNKLSAFEIDMFLANLVKELDPSIELPEISKEPAKDKTSDAKSSEKEPEAEEQEGEDFQVIKSATKVDTTKRIEENETPKSVSKSAGKTKQAKADQADQTAKSSVEESGKSKASIGEIHEMIEDIVKTATIFEKSRKTRRIKMAAKSIKKDAPSAS